MSPLDRLSALCSGYRIEEVRVGSYFDTKCQLLHIAYSLREKGLILMRYHRMIRFAGLGIAPLLILAAVRMKDPNILAFAISAAGIISLGNWIWSISSLVYKTEKHIEFCQSYPVKIESSIQELETSLKPKMTVNRLRAIALRANRSLLDIKGRIEEEHLVVQDWINIKSQQLVLSELPAKCASCGKKWESAKLLDKGEIKRHLRRKHKHEYCLKCGQRISKED